MPNEEFEKWAADQGYSLAKRPNGNYLSQQTCDALLIADNASMYKNLNSETNERCRLEEENAALKAEVEMHEDMEKDFRRTISALTDVVVDRKAEVERLRADAERYRFLQSEAYECVVPHGNRLNGSRTAWITKLHPGNTFDAAIDAAMKETK